MRTRARRPTAENQDAMDVAFDLGQERLYRQQLERELEQVRAAPAQPRKRGKVTAHVDPDGTVYAVGGSGTINFLIMTISSIVIGGVAVLVMLGIPATALVTPATLPTAAITTPTQRPAPTAPPRNDPPPQPAVAVPLPTEAPAWPDDGGADLQQPATEAEINAWLEAPPSTPTPLPEPGAPGFVESFEDAPQCSPFVGYLAGDPCIAILAGEE